MKFVIAGVCGLLLTTCASAAEPQKKETDAEVNTAKRQLKTLTAACTAYKLKYGDYPEKLEQLVKPPDGRAFLDSEKAVKDPWGKQYEYDAKGNQNNALKPDIWVKLPSGKTLGNWPEEKKDKK